MAVAQSGAVPAGWPQSRQPSVGGGREVSQRLVLAAVRQSGTQGRRRPILKLKGRRSLQLRQKGWHQQHRRPRGSQGWWRFQLKGCWAGALPGAESSKSVARHMLQVAGRVGAGVRTGHLPWSHWASARHSHRGRPWRPLDPFKWHVKAIRKLGRAACGGRAPW